MISESVRLAVKNKDFSDYSIEVHGNTGKGDGYLGRVAFVTVTGQTKSGKRKTLNLVIKTPTSSNVVRSQIPIKEIFAKEIYVYEDLIPAFRSFQEESGIEKNLLDLLPASYATQLNEGKEMLVLENLKSEGFDLWDRTLPMPYDHIKLLLQAYGQWHGISLALKHKRPETFRKLVSRNNLNMWPYYIGKTGLDKVFFDFYKEMKEVWQDEQEIAEEMSFSMTDVKNIFADSCSEDPDYQAILHGDCWTNNFLFKIQEGTKTPAAIRIIDWQLSGVGSPVLDLSYFVYTCVDTEIYRDVKELLAIYYSSLSNCLRQFGCDPFEVFSYEKLVEHWKKFSNYGILIGTVVLKFSLTEGDEAIDFEEVMANGKSFVENFNFTIRNETTYHQRIKNNFLHYIRNSK